MVRYVPTSNALGSGASESDTRDLAAAAFCWAVCPDVGTDGTAARNSLMIDETCLPR